MPEMVALKSLKYATRRLEAGDRFEASKRDARALHAVGKANYAPAYETRAMTAKASGMDPERAALREEYRSVSDKAPFNGWDNETLRQKIAEAVQASESAG